MNSLVLRELRKQNKFSQEEMARTIGISLRAYQLKEKGETEFLFSEIVKIADKFNMSLTEFISRIV